MKLNVQPYRESDKLMNIKDSRDAPNGIDNELSGGDRLAQRKG